MVQTRTQRTITSECTSVDSRFVLCQAATHKSQMPYMNVSAKFRKFLKPIVAACLPYTGKRVFAVWRNGNVDYICPEYKIRLNGTWMSISTTSNGYLYIHFLKSFAPHSGDCVFNGDHITIAPSGDDLIHFHVTNISYIIQSTEIKSASSYNKSFCTLPITAVQEIFADPSLSLSAKNERFEMMTCFNSNKVSYNKNVFDTVQDANVLDVLAALFHKAFDRLKSNTKTKV
jgi:hypothetical protein